MSIVQRIIRWVKRKEKADLPPCDVDDLQFGDRVQAQLRAMRLHVFAQDNEVRRTMGIVPTPFEIMARAKLGRACAILSLALLYDEQQLLYEKRLERRVTILKWES